MIESLVVGYSEDWFGTDLGDVRIGVAFVVILGVLLFKPSGLFGSTRVERV